MTNKIAKETQKKIRQIQEELKKLASEINTQRNESTQDEGLSIHNELLDKKTYLEEQLFNLEQSQLEFSNRKSSNKSKVDIGIEATIDIDGKKKNMTLVSSAQADPTKGLISLESPIGQALLGQKVGSKIKIPTPAGERIFSILSLNFGS